VELSASTATSTTSAGRLARRGDVEGNRARRQGVHGVGTGLDGRRIGEGHVHREGERSRTAHACELLARSGELLGHRPRRNGQQKRLIGTITVSVTGDRETQTFSLPIRK
jgi:hypothetical protein